MKKINRKRKKWLKKHGLYIDPKDTWNLDMEIAHYVLPRLKEFKKVNIGYPGRDEADTPEKWDAILDKMIRAFEIADGKYCETGFDKPWMNDKLTNEEKMAEHEKIRAEFQEGMDLFAKWYLNLWW